jgi:hypothetical protein
MEVFNEDWTTSNLESLYAKGEWKTAIATLFHSNHQQTRIQKLLNLIIYGNGKVESDIEEWNHSPSSLIMLKTILQVYSSDNLVRQMEITPKIILWIFSFLRNPNEKLLLRATAISVLILFVKLRKLPVDVVTVILDQLSVFYEKDFLPLISDHLTDSNNPLILITSQTHDLLNIILLKYEQNRVIMDKIGSNLPIMIESLFQAFPEDAKQTKSEGEEDQSTTVTTHSTHDKFQVQLMTLFSISAECFNYESTEGKETMKKVTAKEIDSLILLLQRILASIHHSLMIHDIYQNCFHYLLYHIIFHLYRLSSSSSQHHEKQPQAQHSREQLFQSLYSSVYQQLLFYINDIQDLLHSKGKNRKTMILIQIKKMDIWISFISNFYEARIYSIWSLLCHEIPLPQKEDEILHQTIITLMDLQTEMKAFMKAITSVSEVTKVKRRLSKEKTGKEEKEEKEKEEEEDEDDEEEEDYSKEEIKEIKQFLSEIRKGSISCLENIFQFQKEWILKNESLFWKLSIQSLSTPVFFPLAYDLYILPSDNDETTKEKPQQQNEMLNKMMYYLAVAIKQIENYSTLQSVEDILETVKAFAERNCSMLFMEIEPLNSMKKAGNGEEDSEEQALAKRDSQPQETKKRKDLNIIVCHLFSAIGKVPRNIPSQLTPMKWEMMILTTLYECSILIAKDTQLIESKDLLVHFQLKYFSHCVTNLLHNTNPVEQKKRKRISGGGGGQGDEGDEMIDYQNLLYNSLIELCDHLIARRNYSLLKDLMTEFYEMNNGHLIPFHDLKVYLEDKLFPPNHPKQTSQSGSTELEYEDDTIQFYLVMDLYCRLLLVVSGLFHLPYYHYDNLTAIFDLVYASPPGHTSQRVVEKRKKENSLYQRAGKAFHSWREKRKNPGDILFIQEFVKLFENNDNIEKNEKAEEKEEDDLSHNIHCLSYFVDHFPAQKMDPLSFFSDIHKEHIHEKHSFLPNFQEFANDLTENYLIENNPDQERKPLSRDGLFEKVVRLFVDQTNCEK